MSDELRAEIGRALLASEGTGGIDVRIRDAARRLGAERASVALVFWQMVSEGIIDRYGRRYTSPETGV
jgi:hypothetical protein